MLSLIIERYSGKFINSQSCSTIFSTKKPKLIVPKSVINTMSFNKIQPKKFKSLKSWPLAHRAFSVFSMFAVLRDSMAWLRSYRERTRDALIRWNTKELWKRVRWKRDLGEERYTEREYDMGGGEPSPTAYTQLSRLAWASRRKENTSEDRNWTTLPLFLSASLSFSYFVLLNDSNNNHSCKVITNQMLLSSSTAVCIRRVYLRLFCEHVRFCPCLLVPFFFCQKLIF